MRTMSGATPTKQRNASSRPQQAVLAEDAKDVTTVVNFDFPVQRGEGGIEEYVHRVGRAGRAGRTGSAVTLFTEEEDGETAGDLLALLARSRSLALHQRLNCATCWRC